MNENERLDALPKLKQEGNELYQNKKNAEASKLYAQAIGIIEQLQLKYEINHYQIIKQIFTFVKMCDREKPGEEEWQALADMKIPFLLNYSQCQLLMGNYYDVIEQCTQVLTLQPSM